MEGKVITLHTDDADLADALDRALRRAGAEVLHAADVRTTVDLVTSHITDLVILDERSCTPRAFGAAEFAGVPVIALFDDGGASPFVRLVCDREIDHAMPITARPDAVAVAARRILGGASGARAYLRDRADFVATRVTGAEDRDTVIDELRGFLAACGIGNRKAAALATVADELITNAVYNAPRDASLRPLYAHRSRTDKIVLAPHEVVDVLYGFDGRDVVISVADRFGSLTRADLRRCLRRCAGTDQIEHKDGGAGIGLFTTLMTCDQLSFDLIPGTRTEVIAVVRVDRRRTRATSGHALHLYGAAVAPVLDAIPAPVVLSESFKIDLRGYFTDGFAPATRAPTQH